MADFALLNGEAPIISFLGKIVPKRLYETKIYPSLLYSFFFFFLFTSLSCCANCYTTNQTSPNFISKTPSFDKEWNLGGLSRIDGQPKLNPRIYHIWPKLDPTRCVTRVEHSKLNSNIFFPSWGWNQVRLWLEKNVLDRLKVVELHRLIKLKIQAGSNCTKKNKTKSIKHISRPKQIFLFNALGIPQTYSKLYPF